MNIGGGTLVAGGAFSTSQPMTLTGSGGNASFNPGGYALSLAGALSGSGGLMASGMGTLSLFGQNTYTGTTSVSSGLLKLDFSQGGAPASNIINNASNASPLALTSGAFVVQGNANVTNGQRFNGLTINPGNSAIILSAASNNSLSLNVGAITELPGGLVDFTLPGGTQTTSNGIVTTSSATNGILGAYATVSGANWATVSGGVINPYSAYTLLNGANPTIQSAAASNVEISNSSTGNVGLASNGTTSINTLLLADTNSRTINVGANNVLQLGAGRRHSDAGQRRQHHRRRAVGRRDAYRRWCSKYAGPTGLDR